MNCRRFRIPGFYNDLDDKKDFFARKSNSIGKVKVLLRNIPQSYALKIQQIKKTLK